MNCKTAVHAPTILSNCMTLLAVSSDICCCKKATPTVAMTVKLIISGVCIGGYMKRGGRIGRDKQVTWNQTLLVKLNSVTC